MADGERVRHVGQVGVDRGQARGRQRKKKLRRLTRRQREEQIEHPSDSSRENMNITAIRRTARPRIITANATALNQQSLIRHFCCSI